MESNEIPSSQKLILYYLHVLESNKMEINQAAKELGISSVLLMKYYRSHWQTYLLLKSIFTEYHKVRRTRNSEYNGALVTISDLSQQELIHRLKLLLNEFTNKELVNLLEISERTLRNNISKQSSCNKLENEM